MVRRPVGLELRIGEKRRRGRRGDGVSWEPLGDPEGTRREPRVGGVEGRSWWPVARTQHAPESAFKPG